MPCTEGKKQQAATTNRVGTCPSFQLHTKHMEWITIIYKACMLYEITREITHGSS
jgi:hypothetical protein